MNTRSKKYANYWRQSLADTELGKGVLSDGELKRFTKQPLEALANGVLNTERLIDLFKGEPEHIESIDLIIRPKIFMRKFEHGVRVRGGQPEIIAPMSCCVRVNRAGEMYPSGKTVIARDILEPVDRGVFTIGDVSAMDDYLSRYRHPLERDEGREHAKIWPEYLAYCDQFLYA